MADIVVSGNSSGSVTLRAPDVSGTTILTLPTTSGTIVTTAGAASLTTSGNLTFTGTGNRITGDFSNATFASRVVFQTSTTNGATQLSAIPNGTGTTSTLQLYNNSDIANSSRANLAVISTESRLSADITGTGSYLPFTFYTGGSERLRIDTSGNVGIGTSSPISRLTVNGNIDVGSASGNIFTNNVTTYNGTQLSLTATTSLLFNTAATERMRIDSAGSVLIGGTANPFSNRLYVTGTPPVNVPIFGAYSTGNSSTAGIGLYNDNTNFGIWALSGALTFRSAALLNGGIELMRLDGTGLLLVGATSYVGGGANNSGVAIFNSSNTAGRINVGKTFSGNAVAMQLTHTGTEVGSITYSNTGAAYITTSDYRLKENVAPMTGALAKVQALKPVTYNWKSDGSEGQGFIAHELQAVVPDAVSGEKDAVNEDGSIKPQGIDTSFLVATLTAAIQEQQALITKLQADVAALQGAK